MHIVKLRGAGIVRIARATAAFHYRSARYSHQAKRGASTCTPAEISERVEQFNSRNVVFSVTAGRTGTDSLSHICERPRGTHSLHEPEPNYRYFINPVQENVPLARDFFCHVKVPAILKTSAQSYVETAHLYCKGFFEPSLALGFRPNLIILKRNAREVAVSLMRKNAIPRSSGPGYRFAFGPGPSSYLKLGSPKDLSDYQLCYWHCKEIELRQELYAKVASEYGMRFFELETKQLNDRDTCMRLFSALDLASEQEIETELRPNWQEIVRNSTSSKRMEPIDFEIDAEEAEVENRISYRSELQDVLDRIEKAQRSD